MFYDLLDGTRMLHSRPQRQVTSTSDVRIQYQDTGHIRVIPMRKLNPHAPIPKALIGKREGDLATIVPPRDARSTEPRRVKVLTVY